MKRNVVRVIPDGRHKATIEFYYNPNREENGEYKEFQKFSLQHSIEKASYNDIYSERIKEDFVYIIFELEDGTLFEPFPIRNSLEKGSILREFFESLGYDNIEEMQSFDDDVFIKSKLVIETKKVSRRYTWKDIELNNFKKNRKTYQISKLVSMVDDD